MASNFLGKNPNSIDIDKAKASFIKDFRYIISLGFVPSHRHHNTGIGKTIEDLLKIEENNLSVADYQGVIELKSQRSYTGSMLTLFTKSPSFPNNANSILRERFGFIDPKFNKNIIHTTIKHSDFNNFKDKWGFKLELEREKGILKLLIKNLHTNNIQDFLCYWTFSELEEKIKKCSLIAYINAKTRVNNGREEFHFKKAILLSGLNLENLLESVEKDIILFDIRIGIYKTGKKRGKTHDHGSGFRIKKRDLERVFKIEEISLKGNSMLIEDLEHNKNQNNLESKANKNIIQKKITDFEN